LKILVIIPHVFVYTHTYIYILVDFLKQQKIVAQEEEDPTRAIKLEDRLKMRLEQLEREKKGQDVSYMTQQEYIKHLEFLNEDLMQAWNVHNDRVRAMKIVIRCSKIMAKNSVPQFYPSMFVLACQVLDTFGKLVFDRIKDKSQEIDPMTGRVLSKLPKDFSSKDVSDKAKELCRNWFFKVVSIRELIGRIYVEVSILGCYKFLYDDKKKLISTLERIAKTIRGIGDPLVATYARCFLARKGYELIPEEKGYLMLMYEDFLTTQKQWEDPSFESYLNQSQLNRDQYLDLFSPTIEWIMECIGNNANEQLYRKVLQKYEQDCKQSMVLYHIISSFDADIIANNASHLITLINDCKDGALPRCKLFRALGEKFCVCPPAKNQKLDILNAVWKYVTKMSDIQEYAPVVEVFIEFVCKNFGLREANILLNDLNRHLKASGQHELVEKELQQILLTVLENTEDFVQVFNMEYFLPIFDLLKTSTQVEVSKGMLLAFSKRKESLQADPVIINSIFDLAKTVHDSVNPLSEEYEKDKVKQCLCNFINKVDFGTAFEKQLNFYVDCRRAFSQFDEVKEAIIFQVLNMVHKTYQYVKGKHTKKTAPFVKACLAFCHISIPSIESLFKRMHLFILCGQMAVLNNMLPHADTLFKAAIETIVDIPNLITNPDNTIYDTEPELVGLIKLLISCLIPVPGHPEHGAFYLIRGLLNAISKYQWSKGSDAKIKLYTAMLCALSAMYQEHLPYTYEGVESNDTLYMGGDAYNTALLEVGNTILNICLQDLSSIPQDNDPSLLRKQARAAVELYAHINHFTVLNEKMIALANNQLYVLAGKVDDRAIKQWLEKEATCMKNKIS
jgi:hypothetical protein